ncbi:histidinol-phosphatase HisJ family protein [Phosphitispora sp. TUW77]|uniref:histidinol-phosphatase HisJ family protein n=1 Tax=Phosphitispora sp. TUW77 TaxID=3152361 RepID=UPI003AB1316B
MPIDYHIHTKMCGHASGEMDEFVVVGKQKGLKEIGFADHIPMYFLPAEERDNSIAMKEEELDTYAGRVREMQEKYYPFPIKFGIEADFIPGKEKELLAVLKRHDFDYVLGSIHFLDGWGFDNPRHRQGYDKWDIYELYHYYFTTVQKAAASGIFDSMAHPDLIKKFGIRPDRDVTGIYEDTVREIAASGVCVEINTAGLRVPAGEIYPDTVFVKLCHKYKVPVTLGSDAHQPQYVGVGFKEAVAVLKSAGYTKVVTFTGRNKNYYYI